jgi:CHAT domain-containing protein
VRAFEVAERSRAQSLRELLAGAGVDLRRGVDPQLLERERALQRALEEQSNRRVRLLGGRYTEEELAAADKDAAQALRDYQRLESEIREASPAYAALTRPQPLRAPEIQRELLDPDTLLLEYVLGDERSYLWCVTPSALTSHVLPKRAEVEAAAQEVYRLLTARNQPAGAERAPQRRTRLRDADARYRRAAAALTRMVLGPVAEQLQGKRLLIVADGALQYVPFEALPAPDAPEEPLVVRHEVVYLPSASALAMLRRDRPDRRAGSKTVAVLADPVFDRSDPRVATSPKARPPEPRVSKSAAGPASEAAWGAEQLVRSLRDVGRGGEGGLPRLRFTRREAEAILAVAPSDGRLKAVDFMASRATVTSAALREYRLIHFATHGMLDSVHPELSGLVWSLVDERGSPQNGYLNLQDVYNLDLPAELVVLSACETGLGRSVSGEGLVGLTRGFMYAGARRVVASLWKVDDVATAELMGRFYRAMVREGQRPAAALRQAKVDMWKQGDWRFPYYWAAFEMQGEWQ